MKTNWVVFLSCVFLLSLPPHELRAKHRGSHRPVSRHLRHSRARSRAKAAAEAVRLEDIASYEEPLRECPAKDSSPVWDFWKSTLKAREMLGQENPENAQKVLDLLDRLPPAPTDLINKNQTFYRRLYKQALETGLKASGILSKPTDEWERSLWALFPDLEDPVSSGVPPFARPEDKIRRLHVLFQKSLFETVPDLVSLGEISAAPVSSSDKCRAFFEWGTALQKLNHKEEAVEGYDGVERSSCSGILLTRALYWKGVMESELRRYDEAEDSFRKLAKQSDDGRYRDDAYYRLYRIYSSQNASDRADEALRELIELSEGDMKEKYLWDEAFGAFQGKDYERASSLFDKIIETRSIGTEAQPQALYWKARLAEIRSGKKLGGGAAVLYRRILKTYPFSFYALFAETRLGESAVTPAIAKIKASSSKGMEGFRLVDSLNRKGDHAAAADVLDYLTHLNPEITVQNPEAIAQRWMDSGDFNRALEIATDRQNKSVFDINLDKANALTRAMYPPAYLADVKEAARVNGLPLPLILGVMREESLFLRGVRSHAGAVGLMQLMPATAQREARSLGRSVSYADLKNPSDNIQIGSAFLRKMLDLFGNQMSLAVMSYNAGPGNVARWLRTQGEMPLDEFIESIPFTETRGYVKRVLRSAHIYGHLLDGARPIKPLPSLDPPQPIGSRPTETAGDHAEPETPVTTMSADSPSENSPTSADR